MTTFLVTNRATGAEIYRYSADLPNPVDLGNPDSIVSEEVVYIPPPDQPAPVVPRMYTDRLLDKIDFRRLFTPTEQKAIDRFNATFETHPALTDEQKDDVRTGLENYKATNRVGLDDPDTAAVLGLYTALGILSAGRAQEIING